MKRENSCLASSTTQRGSCHRFGILDKTMPYDKRQGNQGCCNMWKPQTGLSITWQEGSNDQTPKTTAKNSEVFGANWKALIYWSSSISTWRSLIELPTNMKAVSLCPEGSQPISPPHIRITKTPRGIRVHPGRLTWNIIMEVWKIIFLSKWVICRFHVNLPGCSPTLRKHFGVWIFVCLVSDCYWVAMKNSMFSPDWPQ